MDWNFVAALFAGLGVGSIITTTIQFYFNKISKKRQQIFEDKKAAYFDYIAAIQESQFMDQKEAGWRRTAAMAKIELFGSKEVIDQLDIVSELRNTDLTQPLKCLFKTMRKDLDKYQ